MEMRFKNKIVVVTGGSEGIGLATAKRFAAEGAHVYITGRRQEALDAAVEAIGPGTIAVQGDASQLGDLDTLYSRIRRDHGKIDVLFANAGMAEVNPRPLGEIDEEAFDRLFGLNVRGLLFSVQMALPLIGPGGAIVLNGSVAGSRGFASQSLYNATKAAVRSFARSWTAELAPRGIRVNVVAPGGTETKMMRAFLDERPTMEPLLQQMVPLARLGEPDEVASAVLFLASAESRYIAGAELFVDGGFMAV